MHPWAKASNSEANTWSKHELHFPQLERKTCAPHGSRHGGHRRWQRRPTGSPHVSSTASMVAKASNSEANTLPFFEVQSSEDGKSRQERRGCARPTPPRSISRSWNAKIPARLTGAFFVVGRHGGKSLTSSMARCNRMPRPTESPHVSSTFPALDCIANEVAQDPKFIEFPPTPPHDHVCQVIPTPSVGHSLWCNHPKIPLQPQIFLEKVAERTFKLMSAGTAVQLPISGRPSKQQVVLILASRKRAEHLRSLRHHLRE